MAQSSGQARRRGRPDAARAITGRRRYGSILAATLGLLVDGGAAYLFWPGTSPLESPAAGIAIHVAAAVTVWAILWRAWQPGGMVWGVGIATILLLSVPPAGAVLAAAIVLWYAFHEPNPWVTNPAADDAEGSGTLAGPMAGRIPAPRLLATAMEVQPLVDILHADDLELKASAIDIMSRLQGTHMVPVLRRLLTAPEADVRFQASVGLSKLEGQIGEAIANAQRGAEEEPSSAEAAGLLAQLYLDYAVSGLLDETTAAHYARLGAAEFERTESLDPERITVLQRARCHIAAREYREALAALDPPTAASVGASEAALLSMEALFSLGRYDQLHARATDAADLTIDDPTEGALMRWWAEIGK
ncbi:MAG: hypothetical protein IH956_02870 [Chloroflexi bacterium]|nr:hypothetical protein [Chloroflexota bacterium]